MTVTMTRGLLAAGFCLALSLSLPASAQSSAEFYKGKTVQFGVGYPPAGGLDAYMRAAARYIGKYIPGQPNVIAVNVPGASSLIYVRFLQTQAPKDGTQFGMFDRALISQSVLDPKTSNVDFRNFTWIGSMNSDVGICFLRSAKKLSTIADIKASPEKVVLGGTSKNSSGYLYSSIIRRLSPQNVTQVMGYEGTGAMALANERGEIDGNCGTYGGLKSSQPNWASEGKVKVLLQFVEKRHPELQDVQTVFDLVESEQERRAIRFLTAAERIGRPVVAPLGIPADRAVILRKAFLDTMQDSEFLAFVKQAKLDIDVVSGEEAAQIAASIVTTPPEAVELARKLME